MLKVYSFMRNIATHYNECPVALGYRIHRLLFCRGVRPSPDECPVYDAKQSDGEVPLGKVGVSLHCHHSQVHCGLEWEHLIRVLSMGQIELNCVLVLNWIAWNRTVSTFKLRTFAELNCLKWNCFCSLNCIVLIVLWGSSNAGALGNAEQLFITIAPRSTLAQSGSSW